MAIAAGFVIINALLIGPVDSSTCEQFKPGKDNFNKALIGHSVLTMNNTNHHDCARDCMSMSVCKSIDFDRKENRCKLNDVDRSSVDPAEFETKSGSIFSDIKEWPGKMVGSCSSRPCKVNQRCHQTGASHVCRNITCDIVQNDIDNGRIKTYASDRNRFLDKALVKCDIGYIASQQEVKCEASGKWQTAKCQSLSDCKEILDKFPEAESGQYEITLWNSGETLTVNCDMKTEGGGWTIFHKRIDGSVDFYRNLSEYENGFGEISGEFWFGLKYIKELAEQGTTELRLDMTDAQYNAGDETYQDFQLTEGSNYTLNIGSRTTTSGVPKDGLLYNNHHPFSTFEHNRKDCAVTRHGAWWYGACTNVNLNGLYVTPGTKCELVGAKPGGHCGHRHYGFAGFYALRTSSMMIRRK